MPQMAARASAQLASKTGHTYTYFNHPTTRFTIGLVSLGV